MDCEHDTLVEAATDAFDSRYLALKWLQSPCECLDHGIPAEVAKSEDGYALVLAILYRIRGTITHFPSLNAVRAHAGGESPEADPLMAGAHNPPLHMA